MHLFKIDQLSTINSFRPRSQIYADKGKQGQFPVSSDCSASKAPKTKRTTHIYRNIGENYAYITVAHV